MPIATDQQIQEFNDLRIRRFCEHVRALVIEATDIRGSVDDVYEALNQPNPTWTDTRTDAPPHLMSRDDVLAINTLADFVMTQLGGHAQYPIAVKGCVRPVNS